MNVNFNGYGENAATLLQTKQLRRQACLLR